MLHADISVLSERSWSADRQPTYNEGTRATSMPNIFLPASPASASYEVPYQWRHVQPWFTHSSQVGLTTVTAYFLESTKNCWTGSNQFFGPQLAWSWENENSIRFPKISGTLYTGSRFAKESNSNSVSSPSNVFTAMRRAIWPSRCRR